MFNWWKTLKDILKNKAKRLIHWFPFGKGAETIELEIKNLGKKRWIEVSDRLCLEGLSMPQFSIPFRPSHEAYHQKGKVVLSSALINESCEERCRTIDHEIAHYIQFKKNPNLKENVSLSFMPSSLCWIIKGKMNKTLSDKAFREGFATYVASLTSKTLGPTTEKAIQTIQSGSGWKMRWRMFFKGENLPYALGYLTYCAIAKTHSEKHAMTIGLSESPSTWISKGIEAFIKLGDPLII